MPALQSVEPKRRRVNLPSAAEQGQPPPASAFLPHPAPSSQLENTRKKRALLIASGRGRVRIAGTEVDVPVPLLSLPSNCGTISS